jgi:putative ABC transport system permease protein
MNPFRTIWLKLRALGQRQAVKQEIDEELRFHLEERTAANIASGMAPEEAAREARKNFGNIQTVREECRHIRGASFSESVMSDIRLGLRMLWKNPGFTTVAALTLAIGVGGTTAIYSVVNSILLNPVPGPQPDRLVQIAERTYTKGLFREQNNKPALYGVTPPVVDALEAERDFFSTLAWCDSIYLERKTEDFAESMNGVLVPPNFFTLWGVQPLLGRTFAPDEAVGLNEYEFPTSDAVIVLSYSMWQSRFGGNRNVIGRTIVMNDRHFTIIGVMPAWFQPEGAYPMLWLPAQPWYESSNTLGSNTRIVARLRPETNLKQAQAMLDTLAARLTKDHEGDGYGMLWRERPQGLQIAVRPLRAEFQGSYGSEDLQRTLLGLLGAIVFVLLIVCANVANLTLARAERRQHELAVRASMGAGQGRLMRQLLTECLVLSFLGGLGGVAVSFLGMKSLVSLVPASMPRLKPVEVNGHALACTLLISIATGLLFGLMPAWHAGRTRFSEALKQAGTGATAGRRPSRYRSALVVAEVALAVVLLAGAGLMIKSVILMLQVDPGFDPENLVRVSLELPWNKYEDFEHNDRVTHLRRTLYGELQQRLVALPGVRAVGVGKHSLHPAKVKIEGQSQWVEVALEGCGVGPSDLFDAMRIPLRAGRLFDNQDLGQSADTAMINEAMARQLWPGERAVGKRFGGRFPFGDHSYQVVGVVGDIRDFSYNQLPRPTFYRPGDELSLMGLAPFLMISTKADPHTLISAIRRELKAAEPAMRTPEITIESQVLYDSTQAQRTYMVYLVVFAGVGLLLCAIGIYGVLAYSVLRRMREIGIRMALGAQRVDVLRMVMLEGGRLVLVGLGVGLLAAFWLTRLLQSQLFEVSPTDPLVMTEVVLVLLAVALLACYIPARRATKTDPMTALRYE